jgi:5-methylcytosine-specific restriction enzyme A
MLWLQRKFARAAAVAATYLDLPSKFILGPIDLAATAGLGRGYERGAVASVAYNANDQTTEEEFLRDFSSLLSAYDILRNKIGPNIVEIAAPPTEDDFQEAAAALAKEGTFKLPPDGPVPPTPKSPHPAGSRFRRDPQISGGAISKAGYLCEVDPSHISFVARTTKKNFVEAHHLIPLQFQEQFAVGLDVVENVIALCPMCHRKLHHGRIADKAKILLPLQTARATGLKGRGLQTSSEQLVSFYRAKLEEE